MADVQQRIDALSGGAPLPQAATMAVARRLLGPQLAERYGDVIGARERGVADFARDFSVGFISGDPTKADQLKMQVMENYNRELDRAQAETRQSEADARARLGDFFTLLSEGKKVPRELRGDFFKEGLTKIGVEPTSPLFLKVLSNYEKFGSIYDALGDPDVKELADRDPLAAVQRLVEMGHDGAQAIQVAQSVQQMKRYRAETTRLLSLANRAGIKQQDPTTKARAAFIGRMAGRQVRDKLGRSRLLSPAEIEDMADRFFPVGGAAPAAPAPAPEAAAPAGIPQVGSTTTTPTTTGLTQVPEAAAPAPTAAEAVGTPARKLTGSVTRVE